jgi:serine/threonine protein kinase
MPLDRIVLEDQESRVIGFTTKYMPGGTLANPKIPFRFEWLQQLTQVVDFLNLELGIMHQDIAPRNLLIDPCTHKIVLFDFDRAASGKRRLYEGRDDVISVVFTLYELVTNDTSFSGIPHSDRHIEMVQSISEWIVNRELDSELSKFRNFLSEWVATRRSDGNMERYLNAPNRFIWPELPTVPDYDVPFEMGTPWDGKPNWMTGHRSRSTAMKMGQYCFLWERPPQSRSLIKAGKSV